VLKLFHRLRVILTRSSSVYVNPYAKLNDTERIALGNFTWDDKKYYCGPRCGYTLIYRFLHREEDWSLTKRPHGDFWNCTTEVSKMQNIRDPRWHNLSDNVAARAASSMGSSALPNFLGSEGMVYHTATYNRGRCGTIGTTLT
jgi:hypothetical protein